MDKTWRDYFYKGLAIFLTVAGCILFYFAVFRIDELRQYAGTIGSVLRPFIFGAVIAYLLCPVCNWIEQALTESWKPDAMPDQKAKNVRKLIRGVSIFISLLLFCLVIYALIAMIVPQLFSSVLSLFDAMPGYIQNTSDWIEKLVADNPVLLNYVSQYSEDIMVNVQDFAKTQLVPNINNIISGVSTSLWTVAGFLWDFVIGLIVAVYLMGSRKMFARQAKMVVHALFPYREGLDPQKEQTADWILREVGILNAYLGGFVKGKLLDSLIIGLICMVCTGIMDMPYAMLVSVVIGVTNVIPFFGPFIGAIPTAALILMVSPIKCVYFVVFILILQQFDGNILGPKILGNTTNLNTFWVLFAILLFGGLFGIVGMVIGVPIFAFIYQLLKEWIHDRLKKQKLPEK